MDRLRQVAACRQLLWLIVIAACAAFSATRTEAQSPAATILNSERIESRFGNYGIDVLASDSELRHSNLFSTDARSGVSTTRTLALVEYPTVISESFAAEHRQILDGGSIGATFKAAGWMVLKENLWFGDMGSSSWLEGLMRLVSPARLAVHVYALEIERDGARMPYARIVEVHHPDYLSLDSVRDIYAPDWPGSTTEPVADLLDLLARKID